jgi:enamine deaminase RidA (YjgF/YER057c/UK114 family)
MIKTRIIAPSTRCSAFSTQTGADEYFLSLMPEAATGFEESLQDLKDRYQAVLSTLGLSENTQVFSRLHVSDITNQNKILKRSGLCRMLAKGALSVIQQRPVKGECMALFSYHARSGNGESYKREKRIYDGHEKPNGRHGVMILGNYYRMLWTAGYSGNTCFDSRKQTDEVFASSMDLILGNGMTLLDNTLRTWIYVRDIDNHYRGMVKSRREFFAQHGLTHKTRFLASTGIEGRTEDAASLVSMDSLSIGGLKPGQVERMQALKKLSPTIAYGVTFERGLKVMFGDRTHFYISGTASINRKGELMYPNDVKKQTERTIENIRALLSPHSADMGNMAYFKVFLRDPSTCSAVEDILSKHVPEDIPCLILEAPVCRPGWLVEMEGVGMKEEKNEYPDFL